MEVESMVQLMDDVLLTVDEFGSKMEIGTTKARKITDEGIGNYTVKIGKRKYVCLKRYEKFIKESFEQGN